MQTKWLRWAAEVWADPGYSRGLGLCCYIDGFTQTHVLERGGSPEAVV